MSGDSGRGWVGDSHLDRRSVLKTTGAGIAGGLTLTQHALAAENDDDGNDATEIENWHDLDAVREDLDGDYVLVADLDAQTAGYDEHVGDPEAGWDPIGGVSGEFTGTFDGQGHEIADLVIDRPETGYVGLFGASEGIVKNVTLFNSEITGGWNVGGLVGGHGADIVAENRGDGEVSDSSVHDTDITGDERIGGLVGWNRGEVSDSSVHDTDIIGDSQVGGLIGRNHSIVGEVSNSHYNVESVEINGEQQLTIGGIFDDQYQDWLANDRELWLEDYEALAENDGWIELTNAKSVREALGFIDDPDLEWRLQADLDLVDDNAGLYLPYFTGYLDGNGHTVTVDLILPAVSSLGFVGQNRGTLVGITAKGTVTGGTERIGGLVGWNGNGNGDGGEVIESSVRDADITGEGWVGGLVGDNEDGGEVIDSSVHDTDITGDSQVGGLMGNNFGEVSNSHYNVESVEINGEQQLTIGGIFDDQYQDWLANDRELWLEDYEALAENDGWIELTNAQGVREALGFIDDPDLDWRLQANLDLVDDNAGLYLPYFTGYLDGNGHTVTVDLILPAVSSLGFVGQNRGTLVGITAKGTITGDWFVGGLVGRNMDGGEVIESSVCDADITGDRPVGGLVATNGLDSDVVESSVRNADITGDFFVGGFIGDNNGDVVESWSASEVNGGLHLGGFVGRQNGTVTAGFWDSEATEQDAGIGSGDGDVTGLTTDEMQGNAAAQNMDALDFEETWQTVTDPDDYPLLQFEEPADAEPSVADYADEDDVVQTDGLRAAVDDWRANDTDTDLLRDVVDAWRSGEPVE